MDADLWGAAEAIYRLRGPNDAWLRGLLDTLRPHIDRGLGVYGCYFDARAAPALSTTHLTGVGVEGRQLAIVSRMLEAMGPPNERTRRVFALRDGCGTVSEVMTPRLFSSMPHLAELTRASAIRDIFGLLATDPGGVGCTINAPLLKRTTTPLVLRRRWGQIAAHIAAALRLRRVTQSLAAGSRDLAAQVEAIFDLRGRPQHLAPVAQRARPRTQLANAVHRRELARSKLRRLQPEEALSEWSALVGGRWSLLDEVESDGRRFIVARRNPVPAPPLATLTSEQAQVVGFALLGHSNKLIAYELGITETSVAMRLSRAGHKLGARSRVAMIRTVRQLLGQVP